MGDGRWRSCDNRCGNCSIASRSTYLRTLKPDRMLEWAHSVIDIIEDVAGNPIGIPSRYEVKCDMTANVTGFIMPANVTISLRPNSYEQALISAAVREIEATLTLYCRNRKYRNRLDNDNVLILSESDIADFKRCMMGQIWFSVVHAALDEISIVSC